MPFAADAAGLGKLTVFSGLGEPLNAEIELSATKEELSSLAAKIAPADTYEEQGLQRPSVLGILKLELGQQSNGNPVIKLSSAQSIEDPFLDMLIQVEWSNGRLLREYTALLDPPGYGEKTASATVTPQVTAPATSTADAVTNSAQKAGKSRKGAASKPPQQAAEGEYTTHSGDTLRSVAKQMQIEGVSLEQMLVGLYRTNPEAFAGGNMNRLKTGQIMRAPAQEELQSLTQQEAVKEIRVHTSDWHAYRQKLAGAVADSEAADESAQGQTASGKITTAAEDKGTVAPTGPRDVVKLSKGEATAKVAGPETPASKEDEVAREKAAREADARVASLEKQVQEMQKLLEIKNKDLAALQQSQDVAPAAQPPQPVQPPEATPAPVAEVKPPVAAEAKPAEPPAAVPPAPKKPRHAPPPVAQPAPAPEPDLLEDPVLLGGVGGGLIAALLGGWIFLRNKRRKGLDSFEQGILTTSGLKPNTVFGNTAGGMVDTGDTSFLTDLSQGTGGMIDTNDVDPIAEAEVYMAYGRDVQAEEILKDAIVKDPKRYELHQKLLEIYANRKDTTAFETLAGELYATLGPTDANWQKFAAMGLALEPGNPLYQGGDVHITAPLADVNAAPEAPATVFASPEQAGAQEIDTGTAETSSADAAPLEIETAATIDDNGLDFDLGADHAEAPLAEAGDEEAAALASPEVETLAGVEQGQDAGLDFSFDLPEQAQAGNVQLEAAELGMEPEVAESLPVETLPELEMTEPEAATIPEPVAEEISFDLPELGAAESTSTEQATPAEVPELDIPLELPELDIVESVPAEAAEPMPAIEPAETPDISFELPEKSATEQPAEVLDVGALELPSLDLEEIPADKEAVFEAPATEEIVLETATPEAPDLDFDFDMDIGTEEPAQAESQTAAPVLPDLNLSGISLDLEEPTATAEAAPEAAPEVVDVELDATGGTEVVEEITLSGNESADVDTKLDLVSAYMDMGDTEGARELLEEVMREGGPNQRERAQGLLDSLG